MANHWMQHEASREKHAGTKGSFTRLAHRHGLSVGEEVKRDEHKPGHEGQMARMAKAFRSARK
jgi:hypothetical protein